MRTTLTLDRDVAARIRDEMARTGTTLKRVVNLTLRRGFESPGEAELAAPFEVRPRRMCVREGLELDNIHGLLDSLDGQARR